MSFWFPWQDPSLFSSSFFFLPETLSFRSLANQNLLQFLTCKVCFSLVFPTYTCPWVSHVSLHQNISPLPAFLWGKFYTDLSVKESTNLALILNVFPSRSNNSFYYLWKKTKAEALQWQFKQCIKNSNCFCQTIYYTLLLRHRKH